MAIIQALQPLVTGVRTWINTHASDHFSILSNAEILSMERKAREEYERGIERGKYETKEVYGQMLAHFAPFSKITIETPDELLKMTEEAYQAGRKSGYAEGMRSGIEEGKRQTTETYQSVLTLISQSSQPLQKLTALVPAHEPGYYRKKYFRTGRLPGDSGPLVHAVPISRPLPRLEQRTALSPRLDFAPVDIDWKLPTTEDPILLNDEQPNDDTIKTQAIKKGA